MIKENADTAAIELENEMGNDPNVFSVMSMGTYILVSLNDVDQTKVPTEFGGVPIRVMQATPGAGMGGIRVSGPAEVLDRMG